MFWVNIGGNSLFYAVDIVESKLSTFPVRLAKGSIHLYHRKHSFHSSYSALGVWPARLSHGIQRSKCNELMCCCLCLGRAALQKRVMALLRRIEHPTAGNTEVCSLQQKQLPRPHMLCACVCVCVCVCETRNGFWSRSNLYVHITCGILYL